MDLKELSKDLHLIVMPSSLWAIHKHPQNHFIAVLHIQIKLLAKVDVDKGIIITCNDIENTMNASFFIQNSYLEIPSLNNSIKNISDLTNLIYYIDSLQLCPNSRQKTEYPQCDKYIVEQHGKVCASCHSEKEDSTEPLWKNLTKIHYTENVAPEINLETDVCYSENLTEYCIEELFVCKLCGKNFITKLHLENHLLVHTKVESLGCEKARSLNKQNAMHPKKESKVFKETVKLEDNSSEQFRCDICNKVFLKFYSLKLHEKIHTGVRPYVCSMCQKTYTTHSNLATHVRSVHTNKKPHACSICHMSFVHPRHLRIHMRKHTGEKPYNCLICSKTFAKNIHLTVHMRTHTGEKPHICTFCSKGFTTTGNLSAHKRVHHKDIKRELEG